MLIPDAIMSAAPVFIPPMPRIKFLAAKNTPRHKEPACVANGVTPMNPVEFMLDVAVLTLLVAVTAFAVLLTIGLVGYMWLALRDFTNWVESLRDGS